MAAGDLGEHPRATVREMDATAIDAPDRHFDLAVFVLSFHHLPPSLASQVIAEGTRVADKLLIIDLPRPPSPLHLLRLATMLPFAPLIPFVHDGVISSLRTYSPSALRALAAHADPSIEVQLRGGLIGPQVAVASRRPQSMIAVVVAPVAALGDEHHQEDGVEDGEQQQQAAGDPQRELTQPAHPIGGVLRAGVITRTPTADTR